MFDCLTEIHQEPELEIGRLRNTVFKDLFCQKYEPLTKRHSSRFVIACVATDVYSTIAYPGLTDVFVKAQFMALLINFPAPICMALNIGEGRG